MHATIVSAVPAYREPSQKRTARGAARKPTNKYANPCESMLCL